MKSKRAQMSQSGEKAFKGQREVSCDQERNGDGDVRGVSGL